MAVVEERSSNVSTPIPSPNYSQTRDKKALHVNKNVTNIYLHFYYDIMFS